MKKIVIVFLLIISIGIIYLIITELSYSPLKKKEFQMLFSNYNNASEKICGVDFLGMNFRGEVFDAYLYKTNKAVIKSNYPNLSGEWENKSLNNKAILSKWKHCPIDSLTLALYEFTLTANDFNKKDYLQNFNIDLRNSKNYYSYVYINELENYFLLYCPDKENLYYIRKRGF